MQTQILFIRINLLHCRVATDNLVTIIEEDDSDILCIQEPYTIQNKVVDTPIKTKFSQQEKEETGHLL